MNSGVSNVLNIEIQVDKVHKQTSDLKNMLIWGKMHLFFILAGLNFVEISFYHLGLTEKI